MNNSTYAARIEKFDKTIARNVALAGFTTFNIGGKAEYFAEAKTKEDLIQYVTFAIAGNIPFTLLGGGSNVLISDSGIKGLVIRNVSRSIALRAMKGTVAGAQEVYVEADSGTPMNLLIRFTVEEGLAGLEMHLGLPGTVGGAVYTNAKWMHPVGNVGNTVYQATIITPDGQIRVVDQSYFRFGYGYSRIQETKDVIVSVLFRLKRSTKDILWKIAEESIAYRRRTQPQGVPSAGCIFKNIDTATAMTAPTPGHMTSAGFLIDHAGLKDAHIGGACISDVHANFIINKGKATASDVIQLIHKIQKTVYQQYGVRLKEEVLVLGN